MGIQGFAGDRRFVFGVATVLGLIAAAVDNFAAGGEVSPITIIGLLSASAGLLGFARPRSAWASAVLVGAWVPAAHLAKHVLGLPDTLHPNTYRSIAMLTAFCLVVSLVAAYLGALAGWAAIGFRLFNQPKA